MEFLGDVDVTGTLERNGVPFLAAPEMATAYYFSYTSVTDARPDWDGPVVWVDVNGVGEPANWVDGDYLQDSNDI